MKVLGVPLTVVDLRRPDLPQAPRDLPAVEQLRAERDSRPGRESSVR